MSRCPKNKGTVTESEAHKLHQLITNIKHLKNKYKNLKAKKIYDTIRYSVRDSGDN